MLDETPKKRAKLTKAEQLSVFRRDRWLCHWCSRPVIFGPVMKYLELELRTGGHGGPLAYYHPHWARATAPLLDELGAILDHVIAFTVGGPCELDNLVTACSKCNSRKGSYSTEEWAKRPIRKPIKGKYGEPDVWDGMSHLFVVLASRHASARSQGEREWIRAMIQT